MIVTIDGPAGTGKSTVARRLAARLGYRFLDTGAMYRAVALKCLRLSVDPHEEPRVADIAEQIGIRFDGDLVYMDGEDVTTAIRSPEVTLAASIVAANPRVRRRLDELQRLAAQGQNIVTEGRDQGTVVFPNAECKFFLTASPEQRARRRHRELLDKGLTAELAEIMEQQELRDQRDQTRAYAPLRPADDALIVDTSELTIEQVLDLLAERVR